MLVQVGLEGEGLIAALASVVLEGRVRLHVGAEVGAVCKGFPAVGTCKGLFSGVRAHVALQQPRPTEGLTAHVTLVLQVVGKDVHGQRWHGHVHFATGGALAGHLAVQAAVRLLVPAEVGGGGVGLAALVAGVSGRAVRSLRENLGRAVSGTHAPMALGFSPRAPIRDEEGIHGVALIGPVRLAAVVTAGRHPRLRAVGLLEVGVAVLFSSADRAVERVRHQPVLQLLFPLEPRWRDVILDVAILAEADAQAGYRVRDGACESEILQRLMVVIGRGYIGRREII